jgi:hypothetical protein
MVKYSELFGGSSSWSAEFSVLLPGITKDDMFLGIFMVNTPHGLLHIASEAMFSSLPCQEQELPG